MSTVLVIDDEPMIRWSIEQTLHAQGHEVISAGTAAEGMTWWRQRRPEIVLLDVRLPDENGLVVLEKICDESTAVAVIVMTAFADSCTPEEATRLGAADYLAKPFDFDELEPIVRRALARRSTAGREAATKDPAA